MTALHAWSKNNSIALQVIKNSCELDTLFEIWEISSAKIVWNTLKKKYIRKNTSSDLSLTLMHMHAQTKMALNVQMFKFLRKIIT
jgi:hypothetical protein